MLPVALAREGTAADAAAAGVEHVHAACTPAKALARPVLRVSWKCSLSVASGAP
jgi:hypothetical protein